MSKTVIEMAREAGYTEGELAWHDEILERFAELVRADAIAEEREACAKLCERMVWIDGSRIPSNISLASTIRARSKT